MQKIKEIKDLSKETLDIDIKSLVFENMLKAFDYEIQRVIKLVYKGKFESGEIVLKLNIAIPELTKSIPALNDDGDLVNEIYKYKSAAFEHKIGATLKKQYKTEGRYCGNTEVIEEDGNYFVKPLKESQINLEEYMRERDIKKAAERGFVIE